MTKIIGLVQVKGGAWLSTVSTNLSGQSFNLVKPSMPQFLKQEGA